MRAEESNEAAETGETDGAMQNEHAHATPALTSNFSPTERCASASTCSHINLIDVHNGRE